MSLSNLICPLLVSWCVVHSWQTSEQLLQCSHSDFFRLCSVILGQSWFPVYSFGVFYWAHDQRNRVTCSRARSSTMNSWYVFVLSSSPQGNTCLLHRQTLLFMENMSWILSLWYCRENSLTIYLCCFSRAIWRKAPTPKKVFVYFQIHRWLFFQGKFMFLNTEE